MIGFLDTEGILHTCKPYEQLDFARQLVKSIGVADYAAMVNCEDYLQKQGWVIVRKRDTDNIYGPTDCKPNFHLTNAQKEWLSENCEEFCLGEQKSANKLSNWNNSWE